MLAILAAGFGTYFPCWLSHQSIQRSSCILDSRLLMNRCTKIFSCHSTQLGIPLPMASSQQNMTDRLIPTACSSDLTGNFTLSAQTSGRFEPTTNHLARTFVVLVENSEDPFSAPTPIVVSLTDEFDVLQTHIGIVLGLDYLPFLGVVWNHGLGSMEHSARITRRTLWPWLRFLQVKVGRCALRVSRVDVRLMSEVWLSRAAPEEPVPPPAGSGLMMMS